MKSRILFVCCLAISLGSCTLILPLSVPDNSAKMELLTVDEYYSQFNTFSQIRNEFGEDYSMIETAYTTEYTYSIKSESDWQKNYVTFSVNLNDSIEKYYGKGLEFHLPRYRSKVEVREKRVPMYIGGAVLDILSYLILNIALYS